MFLIICHILVCLLLRASFGYSFFYGIMQASGAVWYVNRLACLLRFSIHMLYVRIKPSHMKRQDCLKFLLASACIFGSFTPHVQCTNTVDRRSRFGLCVNRISRLSSRQTAFARRCTAIVRLLAHSCLNSTFKWC